MVGTSNSGPWNGHWRRRFVSLQSCPETQAGATPLDLRAARGRITQEKRAEKAGQAGPADPPQKGN